MNIAQILENLQKKREEIENEFRADMALNSAVYNFYCYKLRLLNLVDLCNTPTFLKWIG